LSTRATIRFSERTLLHRVSFNENLINSAEKDVTYLILLRPEPVLRNCVVTDKTKTTLALENVVNHLAAGLWELDLKLACNGTRHITARG
jgi:hypothetical protein